MLQNMIQEIKFRVLLPELQFIRYAPKAENKVMIYLWKDLQHKPIDLTGYLSEFHLVTAEVALTNTKICHLFTIFYIQYYCKLLHNKNEIGLKIKSIVTGSGGSYL